MCTSPTCVSMNPVVIDTGFDGVFSDVKHLILERQCSTSAVRIRPSVVRIRYPYGPDFTLFGSGFLMFGPELH